MKINWKVRLKNKTWWLTFVPAVIVAVEVIAAAFGVGFDVDNATAQAVMVINAIFAVLAAIGVNVDVTTAGIGDSEQALTYTTPKED